MDHQDSSVIDIQQRIKEVDRKKEEAEALDQSLRPYNTDNLPYNRDRVIQMAKVHLHQHVRGGYEFGKCLLIIKEHEISAALAQIIDEHFKIPHRSAYRYMQFAKFAANWPKFREVFEKPGMPLKGLALLEGLSDPEVQAELAQFEESGELRGIPEVELQGKTLRELQRENRRLRKEKLLIEEKAQKETDKLKQRIESLEEDEAGSEIQKNIKLLIKGEEQITEGVATLAKADMNLLARDAGSIQRVRLLIDKVRRAMDFLEGDMFPAARQE